MTPPTKLPLTDVVSVAAGERHGLALDKNGIVWAWGQNRHGELGIPPTTALTPSPIQVPEVLGPTLIAAGGFHSFAMDLIGGLTAWGSGWHGQLGRESLLDSYEPVPVNAGSDVTTLSVGRYHTLVVKAGGQVFAFGDNSECQMGTWPDVDGREPTAVPGVGPATAVQAGDYHGLALTYGGQVTAWGNDSSGQLDRADSALAHADCVPQVLPLSGVTVMGAGAAQSAIATGAPLALPPRDAAVNGGD